MFTSRNIKYFYCKIIRKIRNFLLGAQSREFLIFLFFFLVATGFWLLQTLKNDYETEFSIPLKLKNIPNDVVMTSEPVNELRIAVKDKGTVLLNYMLGQSFYPVSIDFNDYKDRGSHVRILSGELERKILGQLNASTKLLNIKPDTIDYIYSKGKAKKIPVRLRGEVTAGPQYYMADTIYSPDSVVVYAPKAILDTIKVAYTQNVKLLEITDTLKQRISLERVRGAKFVPNSIEITFPVDIFTEKTIEIPVIGVGFPTDKILRTFPSKVQVTFLVGLHRFKHIHPDDFILEIPYNELVKNSSDKYTLKFKSLPAGVSHVRIVPEQVDFLIEQIPTHGGN